MAESVERHPLNSTFTWQQPEPPYTVVTPQQATAYRQLGAFILEGVFNSETLTPLVASLDHLEQQANHSLTELPAEQKTISRYNEIVFSAHAVLHSEIARQFAQHPVFQGLCHDLIGGPVRLYWDQLVYKRPDAQQEFPWHQDNGYTFVEPQQYLTCWVALTDATIDNGCPWVAPGYHRSGTLRHRWTDLGFECLDETPENAFALPLRAGSIAVFSSLTPHRTGPNLTSDIRKAYILQYAPDGARVFPHDHPDVSEAAYANDPKRQFLVC